MANSTEHTLILDSDIWDSRLFLGGWIRGSQGTSEVIEPATGEVLGKIGLASPDDVTSATALAYNIQKKWAKYSHEEVSAILRRAGDLWLEHSLEIQQWIIRESGSVQPKAELEVNLAAQECYEAAALSSNPSGEVLRSSQPRLSLSRRVPVGVVGVISPFNFPLILAIRSVAPALALGNGVVLKPDPRTAVSGGFSIAQIFEEAGLPTGLFSVLPGDASIGSSLVSDSHVGVISFTGSSQAGRKVAALAGSHLKRVNLELGGNSSLIVTADVDIERAVSAAAFGSFLHQGQICMSTGRHIVDSRIADEYISALAEHANRLTVGNPHTEDVALGPVIDQTSLDRIKQVVESSVNVGAKLVAGGTHEGLFYRPAVLADVPLDAPAYSQEVFGPVASVVRYDTLEESLHLAADDGYGLALGILCGDGLRALELTSNIPVGIIHINDQTVSDEAVAPFGGMKSSGNGSRIGGAQANIESFTETQWVTAQSEIPEYPF